MSDQRTGNFRSGPGKDFPSSIPFSPWMAHIQPISPSEFPQASRPLVFEGFVPSSIRPQSPQPENHTNASNRLPYSQQDQPPLQFGSLGQSETSYPAIIPAPFSRSNYVPFPADALPQRQQDHPRKAPDGDVSETPNEEAETSADEEDLSMDESEIPGIASVTAEGEIHTTTKRPFGRPRPPGTESRPRKRRKKGTGARGGWSKGLRIGPRPAIDPGAEFNDLYKQATNAFIDDQDTERALELILKAIAINPEIYSAHALLSEIYFVKNDDEKAIAALFSGAHSAPRDSEVWQQVANACLQRSTGDRQTALQQASYCYSRIIHNDSKDFDTRYRRAGVNRELGNYAKAMKDLDTILESMPRNSSVMRQVAEIGIETRDTGKAKSLYEEALSYYKENGLEGEESFTWADILVYAELLAQEEPPELALSNSIKVLKQLSRWLLGRHEEDFWDEFSDDDREWDSDDDPRRIMVSQFVSGQYPLDAYGIGLPLELRVKLGLFRLGQGQDTLHEALAHFEWLEPEGRGEAANVFEYPDLFLEVARALYAAQEHNQALRYFEPLKEVNAYSDTDFWLGIAACSYICGNKVQAIECYEEAKSGDDNCGEARTQLSKLYADLGERAKAMENAREAVRIAASSVQRTEKRKYERKEQRLAREAAEKALKQAYRLPSSIDQDNPIDRIEARLQRKRRRLTRDKSVIAPRMIPPNRQERPLTSKPMTAVERETHRTENILRLYTTLVDSTEAMREGDEIARNTWMDCAEVLITDFRSNRVFYPAERHAAFTGYDREAQNVRSRKYWEARHELERNENQDFPIPSVELSIPTEYRQIHFSDWLDVFLEYALLLANTSEFDARHRCYTVIMAVLDCVVWYHDPQAILQTYICYLACALALRDDATLFNIVLRWFIRTFQFCTDAYRLFSAMNFVYPHSNHKGGKDGQMSSAVFRNGPTQKFMFRQVMNFDLNLPQDYHPEEFGGVPDFMRHTGEQIRPDDGDDSLFASPSGQTATPKEMDVVLLTLYAHILYAGGSFPNALSYYFRALSLDPKNHVVLLSIALSYIHEMLKRQTDNRHMFMLQGWAFFEEYADARREWAQTKNDADLEVLIEREIEFNRARCWQMLGVADLAIRAYEKMLSLPGSTNAQTSRGNTESDWTLEAAYAIQSMYALSGNPGMARDVTEKYLVV
ncbi:uncharacterized protein Z518_06407 [Rhinocladiella mackenziei CBS 650.93]|uniref:RNA polymerase III transcription factor TFIIIC subunit (Tfc4) n=1 Tax=Rhinocladiella mackenziei CBS 650.93 TaxID=1442369 RepID=A0A0D2J8V4_9EURO|nr:uncharacterized protein Z518_06407 [Rhinocladiella mackenziei CBS 650.93]KIX05535.1 hypothetical protein Z518_06407 [Rhinocladiella mackenziei CBS 650.93]